MTYLNKNNLFSYTLSRSLPMGRFNWLDSAKFNFNMMITVPEVAFYKWILNILKNVTNWTMIIL